MSKQGANLGAVVNGLCVVQGNEGAREEGGRQLTVAGRVCLFLAGCSAGRGLLAEVGALTGHLRIVSQNGCCGGFASVVLVTGGGEVGGRQQVRMQERSACSRLDIQMAKAFLHKWALNWLIARDWMFIVHPFRC